MNSTFFRHRSAVRLLIFTMLLIGCCGCVAADPPETASNSGLNITPRGGVVYRSDTALNPTVTPKFDVKSPPPQALTYGVRFLSENGEKVTADLVIPTALKGKAPAVLLLHGLGGRKEDVALAALALARKGYLSLAIDIAGHGERMRFHGKPVSQLDLAETRSVIGQTLADLHHAVDYLISRSEVDPERLGFVGVSIGGIIGGVFIADDPRIKSAALWSAGGDWGRMLLRSAHPLAQKFQKPDITPESVRMTFADIDPLPLIAHYRGPLLLLFGNKDPIVPTACCESLFDAANQPKKRVVYTGGHIPDPFAMLAETVKWFDGAFSASAGKVTARR